jgi:hypothetical protein
MGSDVNHGAMHRLGFSDAFVNSTLEQYHLWEKALENLCEKAVHLKVKDIMYAPGKGEFVNERTTMDEAIHRLIIGRHHSLLVTADHDAREIVGVLRLADVFEFVSDAMHECVAGRNTRCKPSEFQQWADLRARRNHRRVAVMTSVLNIARESTRLP